MPHSQFLSYVPPYRLQMKGKGAPEPTLFGVLGQTKMDPFSKTLGGLVTETTGSKRVKKGEVKHLSAPASGHKLSENGAVGMPPKTRIPGAHFAQVPYAGKFMSDKGGSVA